MPGTLAAAAGWSGAGLRHAALPDVSRRTGRSGRRLRLCRRSPQRPAAAAAGPPVEPGAAGLSAVAAGGGEFGDASDRRPGAHRVAGQARRRCADAAADAGRAAAVQCRAGGLQEHLQACHQPDGRGQERLAPRLIDSTLTLAPAEIPARILLNGKEGPVGLMPPVGAVTERRADGRRVDLRPARVGSTAARPSMPPR